MPVRNPLRALAPRVKLPSASVMLAAPMIVVCLALHLSGPVTPALATDLLAFVAAALADRWLPASGVAVGVVLVVSQVLPPQWPTLAEYSALIPLASALLARRVAVAAALAVAYLVVNLWGAEPGAGLLRTAGLWLIAYAVVWAGTETVSGWRQAAEAATREQLRKQRYAIAWELHDTVAHDLSLISMNLQEAGIRGRVDAKELEPLLEACDAAISHLRGILVLMRLDGSVDESRTDSIGSLDQECRRAMGRLTRHGFVADYSSEGPVGELPQATQRALGKLCYEATSNVIKHGDPTGPVTMRVDADPGSHAAQFTLSNTVLAGRRSGAYTPMGIAGMRNRIEAVGGRLHVGADGDQWLTMASVPGRGGITLNEEAP
jgi:signal transduction histidine kinase